MAHTNVGLCGRQTKVPRSYLGKIFCLDAGCGCRVALVLALALAGLFIGPPLASATPPNDSVPAPAKYSTTPPPALPPATGEAPGPNSAPVFPATNGPTPPQDLPGRPHPPFSASELNSPLPSGSSATVSPLVAGGAVTYGLADAKGAFLNYWHTGYYPQLQAQTPLGAVRFFVPWDAFGTANSSGSCTNYDSSSYTSAQVSAQNIIGWSMYFAIQDHLDVLIALDSYDLTVGGDGVQPTDSQYQCGLYYLINAVRNRWGYQNSVHEYEVYNEPDALHNSICSSTAAFYYVDAEYVDKVHFGSADNFVAGGFSDRAMNNGPDCGGGTYMQNYVTTLYADLGWYCQNGICQYPIAWSGHPYDDPDNSSVGGTATIQTKGLINTVNQYPGIAGNPIWLTETAVWLTNNTGGSGCVAGPGWPDVDSGDSNTYAACVDDNPLGQANAAAAWRGLGAVNQVARVYYYQYQAGYNWDSALIAPSGQPRPSFCVLIQEGSPSWCAANVNDSSQGYPLDQDYQDNPGGSYH